MYIIDSIFLDIERMNIVDTAVDHLVEGGFTREGVTGV